MVEVQKATYLRSYRTFDKYKAGFKSHQAALILRGDVTYGLSDSSDLLCFMQMIWLLFSVAMQTLLDMNRKWKKIWNKP